MTHDTEPSIEQVPQTVATLLRDWHQAVNTKNVEAVLRLCTDDVTVRGPRGTGSGHDLMRSWLERSGIQLDLRAVRPWGTEVLAEQRATWPDNKAEPADCVTVFGIRGGQVSSVRRYDSVEEAEQEAAQR